MQLREVLRGVPLLRPETVPDVDIRGVSYHSRETKPGDLFVAIPGGTTDGHRFMKEAAAHGAAAILCQTEPPEPPGAPVLVTGNSRRGLALASANWFGHPGEEMTLVAVTGTNGKTTTTYLIKQLLEEMAGAKVGLIGTNQNLVGEESLPARRTTPESYELQRLLRYMADSGCRYVVMEASSHALALDRTAGLRFAAGVFTNLTRDHLDFHGTMEAYRQAKGKLFTQCATAIINLDDAAGRYYTDTVACPVLTYSERRDTADLTAKNVRLLPGEVEFQALTDGGIARVKLPIPGGFTIYNALAAMGCGLALGLDLGAMARALPKVRGVKGRVEVVPTGRDFTVIIDYAHTPDALENILLTVRDVTPGRVILVFGCGGDRDRTKRPMMGQIAGDLADYVVVTSDNPRTEEPMGIIREILAGMGADSAPYEVEPDRRAAIRRALSLAGKGDLVLLAGKGHETYQVIGREKRHLDEREEVRAWLGNRETG